MSNRTKNDSWVDKYFQPYDADAHARELAEHDCFNLLVPEAIPGGFRNQLEKFAASDSPEVQAALREAGEV